MRASLQTDGDDILVALVQISGYILYITCFLTFAYILLEIFYDNAIIKNQELIIMSVNWKNYVCKLE